MLKSKRFLSIFSLVTAYQIFGYPVNAGLSVILGLNSQNLSLILRLFFLVFYILTLSFFLVRYKLKKNENTFVALILFWILYSIRFLFDTIIREYIYSGYNLFNSLLLLFGVTVLPLISTYLIFEIKMLKSLIFYCYLLLIVSNILLFYLNINGSTQVDLDSMRVAISDSNENVIVNSITISMSGAGLLIFSVSKLMFFNFDSTQKFFNNFFNLIWVALGSVNLIFGASRGPLFTTIILLFFLYIYYMVKKKSFSRPLFLGFLLIFLSFTLFNNLNSNILIFTRAFSFFEERQNNIEEDRDIEFTSALNQFYSSPIIGDKIVTNSSNWFPHNIVLESLMSIGVIGTFLLVLILFYCLIKCKKILQSNINVSFFLVIIFFELFSSSLISGSIPLSNSFWIIVSVLLTIKLDKTSREFLIS